MRQKRRRCKESATSRQRLIAPTHALFDQHQAHVGGHGDRGSAQAWVGAVLRGGPLFPERLEAVQQAGAGEEPIELGKLIRQESEGVREQGRLSTWRAWRRSMLASWLRCERRRGSPCV